MLFLGDKGHYHGLFPWVSVALVVVNVFVFTAQLVIGDRFTNGFSLVPEEIVTFRDLKGTTSRQVWVATKGEHEGRYTSQSVPIKHYPGPVPIFLTLLTSMFMHGGFFHLISNMWCLLIFGRNVECAMGHKRFLFFYLGCGVLAGLAHVASDPHSVVPCLGASGAIAGVMGAYVSIYPLNVVKVWFIAVFDLPALVVIGAWVILQYVSAMIDEGHVAGVAYWSHLGGFFAGFIILRIMVIYLRREKARSDAAAAEQARLNPPKEKPVADHLMKLAAADPGRDQYSGYVTMQTIRRMQEQKNQENPPAQA